MKSIYKWEFKNNFKVIPFVLFSICFPIVWVIVVYFMIKDVPVNARTYFVPTILIMNAMMTTLIGCAVQYNSMRVSKQLKQIALAKITPIQYLAAIYLFYLTLFMAISVVQYIVIFTLYKIPFHIEMLASLFALPLIAHLLGFSIALIIANITNVQRSAAITATIVMYVMLFSAGFFPLIPVNVLYYLQLITPMGLINAINQSIVIHDMSDRWYAWIILGVYMVTIGLLCWKTFKWI